MASSNNLLYMDQFLQNVSIGYQNDDFYGEKLFPPVPVDKETGRVPTYAFEKFRRYESVRKPGSEARQIAPWTFTTGTFYCVDHSLKDLITDEQRRSSVLGANLEINTTENLNDAILLDLELTVAAIASGGTIPNTTLSGTSQWSDYVNSDPIAAVEAQRLTIKTAIIKKPNTFLVSYPVHLILRQHPKIIDRFKYTSIPNGYLSEEQLKTVFEVENYWVAGAEYDTAHEGQSPSLAMVWGKNAMLAYVNGPDQLDPVLGYNFRWTFGEPDMAGVLTKRWREEKISADIIEVHRYYDPEVQVSGAGFTWINAVA